MRELTVKASLEFYYMVEDFVSEALEQEGVPVKAAMQIAIAVDEIFTNISGYAYDQKEGNVTVRVERDDRRISLTFIDEGFPFDPLKKDDPDITESAQERKIGGLGIFMVKKIMDDVRYEYKDNKNILTISKDL